MITFQDAIAITRDGRNLTAEQTGHLIDMLLCGQADADLVGQLLLAIREKGEAVDELVGAAQAMRRHMTTISHPHTTLLDTCGTGGSGSGTFNISTATAIVTAACGVAVAKHGNRRATSHTGSADVLAVLGVAIEGEVEQVSRTLQNVGICFCFAPKLHPAMRHVVAIRRALGVPTLFNLLGPLCNPAGATHQLLGTATLASRDKIAAALQRLGTTRSAVVWGEDGQDEVTLGATTHVAEIRGGQIIHHRWTNESFGLPAVELSDLQAADPEASARIIQDIFAGKPGPCRDVVLAGTAAALWLVGKSDSLVEGARQAAAAIDQGKAKDKLAQMIGQAQPPTAN
jgi:anthranilate phosphoribosyltransferase